MSSKLHKIPHFNTYDDIRAEMQNDLQYRLADRTDKTSLGRPLYYRIMEADNFSFRFLSGLEKKDYPVKIWNDLQNDYDIDIHTFRIGDFFVYATFDYMGKHARLTLGDMWQQRNNDYKDGYSNIIIHPDGTIGTNWR